jgi:hypothetical protein
LEFGIWNLEFGAWNLEFGASSLVLQDKVLIDYKIFIT